MEGVSEKVGRAGEAVERELSRERWCVGEGGRELAKGLGR